MEIFLKIALSVLLFSCLLDMPYGYYQLVRFSAMTGFGILAYHAHLKGNTTVMILYSALALLFQPFFKVALGRELWNLADVLIGAGLIISLFRRKTD